MNRTALAASLKLPVGSVALLAQTIGHFAAGHEGRPSDEDFATTFF
jgi:hypothetical protein